MVRLSRALVGLAVIAALAVIVGAVIPRLTARTDTAAIPGVIPSTVPPTTPLELPSAKGLNYGIPRAVGNTYVGTQWARSDTGVNDNWPAVRDALESDLATVERYGLGKLVRLFIGLDQLMNWDSRTGYHGYNSTSLGNLDLAFDAFDRHGIKAIVVLYDQEQLSSVGNFHFQALDGSHVTMRSNYLVATEDFMRRYEHRKTVVAWDLFNEAYNSLSTLGGLPMPPAADPVSPGYAAATVQRFLIDLYQAAKRGAPNAWLTVSDSTQLYRSSPDPSLYAGTLDFYDIHVYDNSPKFPDWKSRLTKPYLIGEAGASVAGESFKNQAFEVRAISYILANAKSAGVRAVLVHSIVEDNVFNGNGLTPTGVLLAASH